MVLSWEGGAPPDRQEWVDALAEALGQDSGSYWVRFYRHPAGWRFELERRCEPGPGGWSSYRRADENTTLRAFTSLVAIGKRLDPTWRSPATVVGTPEEAVPPPDAAPRRDEQEAPLEAPAVDPTIGPVFVDDLDSSPGSDALAEWARTAVPRRSPGRRLLGLVLLAAASFLLAAWWLARGGLPRPPATPLTSPPAAPSAPSPAHVQPSVTERVVGTPSPSPIPTPSRRPTAPSPPPREGRAADASRAGLTPPAVLSQSCPPYPATALERQLSGTAWLTAVVDETGAVVELSRVRASPRGVGFEEAARSCVLSRVYRPATKDGAPVRVQLPVRIEFQPPGR